MRVVFQSITLIAFHLLLQTRFRKSPCKFFSKQLAIFESTASKSPVAIPEMEDDIAKSSMVFACSISLFNAQLEPFLSTVLRNIHFPHSAGPVFASTFHHAEKFRHRFCDEMLTMFVVSLQNWLGCLAAWSMKSEVERRCAWSPHPHSRATL